MAWDSTTTRRRQNSTASRPTTLIQRTSYSTPTTTATLPTTSNPHLTDPLLQPFLSATFDPAAYLNAQLPPLKPRTSSTTTNPSSRSSTPSGHEATLADLSASTQTLLSQLGAHTSRLTATLTELTDAILRGGARLTYEVEVLHGESQALQDALTESLRDEIAVFVPGGVDKHLEKQIPISRTRSSTITVPAESQGINGDAEHKEQTNSDKAQQVEEPDYIIQLKTLTAVREKLDTVIKTFDSALNWTFPPSEVSVSSSLISVSAPEPGSAAASVEETGQAVSKALRTEILELLTGGTQGLEGIVKARQRVEELRALCEVWKGTAEEKARLRFVEGLQRLVDDREREVERRGGGEVKREPQDVAQSQGQQPAGNLGGYGFINHLQKMRGGI